MWKKLRKKSYCADICMKNILLRGNFITYVCIALISSLPLQAIAASQDEIIVSAAASLKNSFEEIARNFETKKNNIKVQLNFAASGDLVRQIESGAPVDVFASAAAREMDELEKKKMIISGTKYNFAENSIVLIKQESLKVTLKTFNDLKNADIKKIAIGNPATVPAGMYAEQTLRHQKVWDSIKNKIIYGEHVRQVLDYVARGEVDAGIVFLTDASVRAKDVKIVMAAPEGSYSKALYPIAVIRGTKNEAISKQFIDFVTSPEGAKIFMKFGFRSVK